MKLKTLSLLACCVSLASQAEVTHIPSDGIKIGERTTISGVLDNSKAIKEARLYFKSNLSDSFIFVDLDKNGLVLQSDLPAPGPSMGQIDYFFAVKYKDGSFERSDVFGTKVKGEWDKDSKKAYSDVLEVQSELDPSKVTTEDFANNVTYGYQASQLLGSSGNALNLSSVSGYTVTASSSASAAGSSAATASTGAAAGSGAAAGGFAGLSTTTIAVGVGAVAVGAGAVAAGSSETKSDSLDTTTVTVETDTTVTGNDNTTPGTGTPIIDLPGLGNVLDANGYETNMPPSSATCGTLVEGSGDIPTTTNTTINLNSNSGTFHVTYNLGGSIADQLVFVHDGVTLYDTGCSAINGGNSGVINLPGVGPNTLEVTITSNCLNQTGTYWGFTVSCP
ncbi:hypothetical protein NBRC116592_06050 [Colwellia sp. KU-HH00111]|uniref:hypothetical protein n=1 Tax=Colwellia sp. KU-HH00111 TaxID=3127652 RepID=UPI0031081A10